MSRSFSGGHDPYMLHLHQEPDKYAKYAHLHWHTADPLEVGKYAKLRSKEEFGSHVSFDPEPQEWMPESDKRTKMTIHQRNHLFTVLLNEQNSSIEKLQDMVDYSDDHGHYMFDTFCNEILATIKPKQMEAAVQHAKTLLAEYKAAGVPVTREKMSNHVHLFILSQLTREQIDHLLHAIEKPLAIVGVANTMNDD